MKDTFCEDPADKKQHNIAEVPLKDMFCTTDVKDKPSARGVSKKVSRQCKTLPNFPPSANPYHSATWQRHGCQLAAKDLVIRNDTVVHWGFFHGKNLKCLHIFCKITETKLYFTYYDWGFAKLTILTQTLRSGRFKLS